MYLSKITIKNFRKIKELTISFQRGLNVIIGENNIGKTAIIDALRVLLDGLQLEEQDISVMSRGEESKNVYFEYTFSDLSIDEEADFYPALTFKKEQATLICEAVICIECSLVLGKTSLKMKKYCGNNPENYLPSNIIECISSISLPPLRDPYQGLRPNRSSQLAKLLKILADSNEQEEINDLLVSFGQEIKKNKTIKKTLEIIRKTNSEMLGAELQQKLDIDHVGENFSQLIARLSLIANDFSVERNGLGFNNLIYMAIVLSEMTSDKNSNYKSLIIEEPEAHLHPQLQAILLDYLQNMEQQKLQIFVTSHSPNLTSAAKLDSLTCLLEADSKIYSYAPHKVQFNDVGKLKKLERYLDVTKAELFFARRIIFVEGTAEQLLINTLSKKLGLNLRREAVSVLDVQGLNFDCFLPLFTTGNFMIKVAVITDADPEKTLYPEKDESITPSSTVNVLKGYENEYIKIFHGVKTFEYDLAIQSEGNIITMLEALKTIHPCIAKKISEQLVQANSDREKAKIFYEHTIEKDQIKKGEFSQALIEFIQRENDTFIIPTYIKDAIEYVCKGI